MQGDKKNYRNFAISKWVASNIESFRKPTELDLEKQSKYYSQIIKKFFPLNKNIEILEIGCGYGFFIYTLIKKFGYTKVVAIDIIPECCFFVNDTFGIKVQCIDVFEYFKNNNKNFDVIVAFDVIEHFNKNETINLMQYIYNSLNKGGLFIMRVPNGGSLSGLYIRYSGFTHEIAYTELSINELFKSIGFSDVYCVPESEIYYKEKNLKNIIKKLYQKIISIPFGLKPEFMFSANIIGIGKK